MDYRVVGRTGVKVSPLVLGTMSFGAEADEAESLEMYQAARERGINFFDTANVYSGGVSEQWLGTFMASERDDVVISSKGGFPMGEDVNTQGLSRRHLVQAVENSLRRLGTDRIDFYFVHTFDPDTPIEETLRALDDLQRAGKILYPAVSNWAAWQIALSLGISARESLARFELIQPMYNLVKRQAEVEILPLAQAENLGVISYSPLGGGLLSGKYRGGSRPEQGRLVENARYSDRYGREQDLTTAERFAAFAADAEVSPVTLAVAWAMAQPGVTAPIIAGRNLGQLEASLAALDFEMRPGLRAEISALSVTPAPATDRAEVLTGRWG
ncbi:aldo/keto reductase [Psychromicrobium xiongbiense]|uniref:aldo/keto reductase n=1 Tax=Psychromicrobium xiongbiense TaxID=3051184 RepID=UPI0025534A8C|nr:aldo/keto reductase [Psychromicrobium sp. YIM S02556]